MVTLLGLVAVYIVTYRNAFHTLCHNLIFYMGEGGQTHSNKLEQIWQQIWQPGEYYTRMHSPQMLPKEKNVSSSNRIIATNSKQHKCILLHRKHRLLNRAKLFLVCFLNGWGTKSIFAHWHSMYTLFRCCIIVLGK